MESNNVRYLVEHIMIPDLLFSSGPVLLLNMIGMHGSTMVDLFNKARNETGTNMCPYSEADFCEHHRIYSRGYNTVLIIRIGMPVPTDATNCRAIYLCYGDRINYNNIYATSELTTNGDFQLFAWDVNGFRVNYDSAPDASEDEMDNIAELFWEMVTNGESK